MDRAKFFATVRDRLESDRKLDQPQVDGMTAILDVMTGQPLAWTAYALATAWHETNGTMQPVREAYWMSEAWRKRNLRYWPWYGRGYVQLTWQENYAKADLKLGLDGSLIANADRALEPRISAGILLRGMIEGWFAGDRNGRHTFERHLPATGTATRTQYMEARRIINGMDKADLIEDYAQAFERALRDGGWA